MNGLTWRTRPGETADLGAAIVVGLPLTVALFALAIGVGLLAGVPGFIGALAVGGAAVWYGGRRAMRVLLDRRAGRLPPVRLDGDRLIVPVGKREETFSRSARPIVAMGWYIRRNPSAIGGGTSGTWLALEDGAGRVVLWGQGSSAPGRATGWTRATAPSDRGPLVRVDPESVVSIYRALTESG